MSLPCGLAFHPLLPPLRRCGTTACMIPLPSLVTSIDIVATALDAAPLEEQASWMHGLSKREMVTLFEQGGPVPLSHFVDAEGVIVEHEGQNSLLPGMDRFEKHVILRNDVAQGFNKQFWGWFTGPGHFTLREEDGTTVFDYTVVAADAPAEWPAVRANTGIPDRFVYGYMVDVMRRVSGRMTVGRAIRHGKPENNYFLLLKR